MDPRPVKNAVMVVQELCVKSGLSPTYTEMVLPNQRPPVFRTNVEIVFGGQTYSASADANTKKASKIKCCEKLLYECMKDVLDMNNPETVKIFGIVDRGADRLVGILMPSNASSISTVGSTADAGPQGNKTSEAVELMVDEFSGYVQKGNPIADLAVFCDKYGLPEAMYQDGLRSGPHHRPILSIQCSIKSIDFIGVGVFLDKKSAKRIAANKMLNELKRQVETGQIKPRDIPLEMELDEATVIRRAEFIEQLISMPPSNPEIRPKILDDFTSRASLERLKNRQIPDPSKFGGPCFKELIEISTEINRTSPLEAKPMAQYNAWLRSHAKGIKGFFAALKDELNLSVKTKTLTAGGNYYNNGVQGRVEDTENDFELEDFEPNNEELGCDDDNKNLQPGKEKDVFGVTTYMIILSVEIPMMGNKKVAPITFDDDVNNGLLNAMVEFIMYLGLMSIF